MDGTMNFVWSNQVQLQHPASLAGYDPHQHQAGQRLHPPVLESAHKNHASSSIPSSSSCQPANIQPHQHHHHYQLAAGFNGPFSSPPLCHVQPTVVQQTPLPLSTVQFPPGQKQSEQSLQQIREASERYFESMQQLLQLQYQHTMELINQQFHWFSMYWSTRQQAHNQQKSSPIITQLQGTSYQAPYPNVVATTAINERHQQKSSMDQLIVPAPAKVTTTQCDEQQQQQQQQQKQQSKTPIAVPAAPDGSSDENEVEHSRQNKDTTEVFNSYNVGSPREIDPKFVQHFLDRNGHRMDSTSGRASIFSDVFVWIVNHGGTRIKLG
ncbi:probable basic-leucine zipper transcription factor Q [Aedes albopictus]|uniref:Uncharacterized protein n=1 Tax=Aedes albopictus TaxID=7160 RepID=A0ABM1XQH1_AEDAL